jgi:CBS domain-containing protein
MQAKDVMTRNVLVVNSDDTILRAIRLMLQNKISGLPVVDEAGQLFGMVTEGDFLRRAEIGTTRKRARWLEFFTGAPTLAEEYVHSTGRKVREVMTTEVHAVPESMPIQRVVEDMEKYRVKRVPVLNNGKLVGIITRANILRAVAHAGLADAKAPADSDDMQIRQQLMDHLEKQPWAPIGTVTADVRNGSVTFTGVIFDDRYRDALRVAAENTPGVKSVVDDTVWIEPESGYVLPLTG